MYAVAEQTTAKQETRAAPASAGPTSQRAAAGPDPLLAATSAGHCSCGGGCPRCQAAPALQPMRDVNSPDDPLEVEADCIADRALTAPPAAGSKQSGSATAPRERAFGPHRSTGQPLEPATRLTMEAALKHPLHDVRVHTGPAAAESAAAYSARAYTTGTDVVVALDRFDPHSAAGQRLLAHELAHVAQQASGRLTGTTIQLAPEKAASLTITVGADNRARFTLTRDEGEPLSALGTASGLEPGDYRVFRAGKSTALTIQNADGSPLPTTSKFYIDIPASAVQIHRLLQRTTTPIPLTVETGDVLEGGTGGSETGEEGGGNWFTALPDHVRAFLTSQVGTVVPVADLPVLRRIADKLAELSESELESFKARTVGESASLLSFELSVERYVAEMKQRRAATSKREEAKLTLFGMDEVYKKYREYKQLLSTSTSVAATGLEVGGVGTSIGMQPTINRLREELTTELKRFEFASIGDFETALTAFRNAFRDEAVFTGREMLDRYEHILDEQQRRYQSKTETSDLYRKLQPARVHYAAADKIRDEHAMTPYTAEELADQDYWNAKFREEQRKGQAAVSALAPSHPLLRNSDIESEELALSSEADVRTYIHEYIKERREEVAETRKNLTENPDLVYELDLLRQAAMLEQGIRPDSLYSSIIKDHIRDKAIERAIINLAIAVFAIAAGLVSGGTGTVAVLAGTAAFGVGAYQAVEEYRRYEMQSAAAGAQLLSEDPSFAWVIVAIVGAGIDLAGVGASIKALTGPARAFNQQTITLAEFEEQVAKLTQIEEKLRANVIRAARAEDDARAAWKSILRPSTALRAVVIPGAEEFAKLVYAVYLTAKRGIISLERFALTRQATDLLGDITKLAPEELALLKTAYPRAVAEMETIVAAGKSAGLTEKEIDAFMNLRANTRGMTAEQVVEEMKALKAAKQSGLSVELTEKQWARLRRVSEALNDETKWVNVTPKDRWRLGRVYDNMLEKLVGEGVKRTGQSALHYVELNAALIKKLRAAGKRVLITEGRLPSAGLRLDFVEIDFAKGRAELIDLTATSSSPHIAKTRSGKEALEKLLGMPVDAKEMYYTGANGELLETLVEVSVK